MGRVPANYSTRLTCRCSRSEDRGSFRACSGDRSSTLDPRLVAAGSVRVRPAGEELFQRLPDFLLRVRLLPFPVGRLDLLDQESDDLVDRNPLGVQRPRPELLRSDLLEKLIVVGGEARTNIGRDCRT